MEGKRRKNDSWIESFLEVTSDTGTSPLFRKWTAIAVLAGTLRRKVWVRTLGQALYPNLYIFLVAPPGIGKSKALNLSEAFLQGLDKDRPHICATSVNFATIILELEEARVDFVRPNGEVDTFHSLFVKQSELGVLIPAYDTIIINKLVELWDNNSEYKERRITRADVDIKNPQLNILAGTTPAYLAKTLPEEAWDQGFLSRTIMVFDGHNYINDLFEEPKPVQTATLLSDLAQINQLYGQFTFDPEVKALVTQWNNSGRKPEPTHHRLTSYNQRRLANVLKLMQISCVDRQNQLHITAEDYHRALGWLVEVETCMEDIFKSMSAGSNGMIIKDMLQLIFTHYVRSGSKPIPEPWIHQQLQVRVPVHSIQQIINTMLASGFLMKKVDPKLGVVFEPRMPPKV